MVQTRSRKSSKKCLLPPPARLDSALTFEHASSCSRTPFGTAPKPRLRKPYPATRPKTKHKWAQKGRDVTNGHKKARTTVIESVCVRVRACVRACVIRNREGKHLHPTEGEALMHTSREKITRQTYFLGIFNARISKTHGTSTLTSEVQNQTRAARENRRFHPAAALRRTKLRSVSYPLHHKHR